MGLFASTMRLAGMIRAGSVLLLGSPFVTKIYRASLRELASIMIFFLDKMAFEYYYSNIRNTGA